MTRRTFLRSSRRGRAALLACTLPCLLFCLALSVGCGRQTTVATFTVQATSFVHRVTAEGTLEASLATTIAVPDRVRGRARIAWLADDSSHVEAGQTIARFDAVNMRLELAEGEADLRANELRTDKASATEETRRTGTEKDIRVAELELDVAERYEKSDEDLFSRHEIIESQIDGELAEFRQRHSTELSQIQEHLDDTELDLLAIERQRAEQRLENAREGMRALVVKAPRSGVLLWQRDGRGEPIRVGQEVFQGQPLGEIPDLGSMKVEVYVLEADAGGLAAGKPARVRIEAHPERWYEARIAAVEPVAKPRFRGSPVQYFGVELELDHTDPERMRPGQRVQASLLLEKQENVLVVPRQAVFTNDDGAHAWVRRGARWSRQEIILGPQSAALAVVEEGLAAGDVVALEDPSRQPMPSPSSAGGQALPMPQT